MYFSDNPMSASQSEISHRFQYLEPLCLTVKLPRAGSVKLDICGLEWSILSEVLLVVNESCNG